MTQQPDLNQLSADQLRVLAAKLMTSLAAKDRALTHSTALNDKLTHELAILTEVTSNTATAAAFLPLLGALAISQNVSPLLFTIPAAIAASCAFMMPVATPPNAIVFGSGHMRISDMINAGFVLNLAGIVVVTLLGYLLMGFVFGV
jgi:solute carrier family 13 (sodium-dependent dicarboxylate transporter), member 2/3/5